MKILSKILISFALLGFLICLGVAIKRVKAESNLKEVDLAIDYEATKILARQFGLTPQKLLKRFKDEGVTSVIVHEDTLGSLQEEGRLFVFSSNQLKERASLDLFTGYSLHPKLKKTLLGPNKTYILTHSPSLHAHLHKTLNLKMPGPIERGREGGLRVIGLESTGEHLLDTGVGFLDEKIKELSKLGLGIILFPSNYGRPNSKSIDYLFRNVAQRGVEKVVFEEEVLGYPQHLATTLRSIENMGLRLVVLEFFHPKGIEKLFSAQMPKYFVRAHRISDEEMKEIDREKALNRFLRSVRERNIRCLYLLPFLEGGSNLIDLNLEYVRELKNRLRSNGFEVGVKNTMAKISINNFLLFLISLGIISAILLLINWIIPLPLEWNLGLSILGVIISLVGLFNHIFLQQFWAIICAITFPVLAMLSLKIGYGEKSLFSTLGWCIKNTLMVTGISFLGALFIIGLLSESEYLLKITQVRGIKAALFLPILGVGVFSYLKEHSIDRLLIKPIQAIHLIGLGILLSLLVLFLARSGNYEFPVFPQEEGIRLILENLLFARPRFKEFLIGYPALLLAIFLLGQGHRSVFLLTVATLSQVSLVNTYMHLHSPFIFQTIRSINGLWFGMLIGMAAVAGGWTLARTKGTET